MEIDYRDQVLETGNRINSNNIIPFKQILNTVMNCPVNIERSQVIILDNKISIIAIPESIAYVKGSYYYIRRQLNKRNVCNEQIKVEPLINVNIKTPLSNLSMLNMPNIIRTSHINSEEKLATLNLCKQYMDIFYNGLSRILLTELDVINF